MIILHYHSFNAINYFVIAYNAQETVPSHAELEITSLAWILISRLPWLSIYTCLRAAIVLQIDKSRSIQFAKYRGAEFTNNIGIPLPILL